MLTRKQKEEIAKRLTGAVKETKTSVLCDFKGMTIPEMSELREQLRENGARMDVAKKTLIKIAFEKAGIEIDPTRMEGQVAVVYGGEDEVSSPKKIYEYSKNNDKLKILGGSLEGNALSVEEVTNLAKLPSKVELLAKVVGTIKAPVSGFVNVLSGNLRNLVYALEAIRQSKDK